MDLQSARVRCRRTFLAEGEWRAKVGDAGWDGVWVEEAVNTAGRSSEFHDFSQTVTDLTLNESMTMYDNLIEVV